MEGSADAEVAEAVEAHRTTGTPCLMAWSRTTSTSRGLTGFEEVMVMIDGSSSDADLERYIPARSLEAM